MRNCEWFLNKMLTYRVGMIPVVQDMESKKTIGLFYLKDVFWLLRSGKYFDKPIHVLLKSIYEETKNDVSQTSECEGEEESDLDENTFGECDSEGDGKEFLENLDEESKNSVSGRTNSRIMSLNIENSKDILLFMSLPSNL